MLTKRIICRTVLETCSNYAINCLGIDPRSLARYVELGLITPAAQLSTGDYLFDRSRLENDRVIFQPLIRTRRDL
jgi:hypothetical protein